MKLEAAQKRPNGVLGASSSSLLPFGTTCVGFSLRRSVLFFLCRTHGKSWQMLKCFGVGQELARVIRK